MISNKSENHVFIILKAFYRAGKRLNDTHIGITYEHSSIINMETTPQGLTGRFCGNNKNNNQLDSPYFYCNIDAITEYIKEYDNKFPFYNYSSPNYKTKENIVIREKDSIISRIKNDAYIDTKTYKKTYDEQIQDIPHVFIIDNNIINNLDKSNKDDKIKIIKKIIDNDTYLLGIINKYINKQISHPGTDDSYRRHIKDTYNAYKNKKPFRLDIIQKDNADKYKNIWMAFYDTVRKVNILIYLLL